MHKSIRSRLTVTFFGLAIIPLLLTGGILIARSYNTQQAQALALQHEVAVAAAENTEQFIGDLVERLTMTARLYDVMALDAGGQLGLLARLQAYEPAFEELTLFSSKGFTLATISRTEVPGAEHGHLIWHDELATSMATGETYYSLVHFHEQSSEPYMQIAVPLIDPRTGTATGIVAAAVRFRAIWSLIAQIQVGESGFGYIVGRNSDVIAHPNPSVVLQGTKQTLPDGDGIAIGMDGERATMTMAKVPLGDQAFTVVVERPLDEVLTETFRTASVIGIIVIIASACATLLGWANVHSIVGPIETLADVVRSLQAGELDRRAVVEGSNEIADLASAFNQTADRLVLSMDELEARGTTEVAQRQALEEAVAEYRAYMAEVGAGRLSARLTIDAGANASNPLVALGLSLNETTARLQRMVLDMQQAAKGVSTAASDIVTTTHQQSVVVSEQAAGVAETISVVRQAEEMTQQAVLNARRVAERAQSSAQTADRGLAAVEVTGQGMASIRRHVESIAVGTRELGQRARRIGDIVGTVQDLADQSRLLAVNAAMEAARAGDAGRGFAVVARELRTLADASRAATEQVATILKDIEKATSAAIARTQQGMVSVDEGVKQAGMAGEAIDTMNEDAQQTLTAAEQIAASAGQRLIFMENITRAMSDIGQASTQSEDGIKNLELSAEKLAALAAQLDEAVALYDLG